MKFTSLDKRVYVKGLALECPLGTPADECPLNGLRGLPAAQMNRTINNLTDEQVDSIFSIHRHCFVQRTKGRAIEADGPSTSSFSR